MIPQSSVVNSFKLYFSNFNRWTFLVAILTGTVYYLVFDFLRWNQYDSASYEAGARLLFGLEGGADLQGRMSKPLALLFPGLCEFAFGINARYGFLIQSGICYVLLVFLWKGILKNLEFSEDMQKMGILMLVMSQPFAVFSFGILADFPGWCCMLWLIYIYTQRSLSFRWLWVVAVTFIGLLVKESIFVGIVFVFVSDSLDKRILLKKKLINGIFIGLTVILSQLIIIQIDFGGLIDRQSDIIQWGSLFNQHSYRELFQIWRAFDGTWWFFIVAIFSLRNNERRYTFLLNSKISMLLCFILIPFIHPACLYDRILFMFFPMVFLVSLYYLQKKPFIFSTSLVTVNGLLSIGATFFIYQYNFSGAFLISFLISIMIPFSLILNEIFKNKNLISFCKKQN